jgi:hypothetical protein
LKRRRVEIDNDGTYVDRFPSASVYMGGGDSSETSSNDQPMGVMLRSDVNFPLLQLYHDTVYEMYIVFRGGNGQVLETIIFSQ